MYHVELRQESTRVRAFNLTAEQVGQRFVAPLRGDRFFVCEDKEFDPRRARLQVLEGPKLRLDQLTLGRGWTEAERASEDVTRQFLAAPAPQPPHMPGAPSALAAPSALRERIFGRLSAGPASLTELAELSADLTEQLEPGQQRALLEAAVLELLRDGRADLSAAEPRTTHPVIPR